MRTALFELGAGRSASGSWETVCARDAVRFGASSTAPLSTALRASNGAPRAPKAPAIKSRALCSWALDQRDVLEARDARSLCAHLLKFMRLNVFSSDLVQQHYRKCMSADEWQREWAGSIARFGKTTTMQAKKAEAEAEQGARE